MITPEAILEQTRRTLERLRPHEAPWMTWLRENILDPIADLLARAAKVVAAFAGTTGGMVLLGALAAAAVVLLVLLGRSLFRRGQQRAREGAVDRIARSSPVHRDPDEAEREAARLAGEGRFVEAVRLLYLATFVRLHRRSGRPFDPSLTPGENLSAFGGESWSAPLRQFVAGYLAASFGSAALDASSYAAVAGLRPAEGRA